ncbi:MAG: hypothetical protein ACKO0Y_08110, partial [Bacteroidota bacterium]
VFYVQMIDCFSLVPVAKFKLYLFCVKEIRPLWGLWRLLLALSERDPTPLGSLATSTCFK